MHRDLSSLLTRRHFFGRAGLGLGTAALATLLAEQGYAADTKLRVELKALHHPAKVKHVIYLFMSGGPSHIDLLDYKPRLREFHGQELPASVRMGQRITGMTSGQSSFPCVAPPFRHWRYVRHSRFVSARRVP